MNKLTRLIFSRLSLGFAAIAVVAVAIAWVATQAQAYDGRGTLVTIYDRGVETVLLSEGETIGDALKEADITIEKRDAVEPAVAEKMVASEYKVNIYRARPVLVIDGSHRQKVLTAFQTPEQIAKDADISLHREDNAIMGRSDDLVSQGAGLQLTIDRAVPFTFDLYGTTSEARTQGETVQEMLDEKNVKLGENDRVSPSASTPITKGMEVRVWREGKQTITVKETVPFPIEQIRDNDRPIGFKELQTEGKEGVRQVTYEIEVREGQEVSRAEIASLETRAPVKQIEVIGTRSTGNGLTKNKGVFMFTDSNGVVHRETYYDLPMRVVMGNCGAGGYYTVREDGAKVDKDGYVIIAANLANYPRCSVVETSLGPGKVYDTGGFAARHPHGWDLATDWTKADGI
jgi:uncharacterized protein YabE (DUF348 family)